MKKERLQAFVDATFAIIITIAVLEFKQPPELTWEGLLGEYNMFIAYFFSFFYLGTVWVQIHNQTHSVEQVGQGMPWLYLVLLFFCSFFPYLTTLLADNFDNPIAQFLYGIDILIIISIVAIITRVHIRENPESEHLRVTHERITRASVIYGVITLIGLLLAITVWRPALLVTMFIGWLIFIPMQVRTPKEGS